MDKFQVGPWLVAPKLNSLSCNGHTVRVEPKAMQVLVRLAEEKGDPVSKEELIRSVWADTFVTDDVLTRSISELRKAFGDDSRNSQFIETIPRGGYRLASPVVLIEPEKEKSATPNVSHRHKINFKMALAIVGLSAAALLVLRIAQLFRPATPQPSAVRSLLSPPKDHLFETGQLAISPDGSMLAFQGFDNGGVWVQSLATGLAAKIPDITYANNFFWSPDGKYVGFCSDGKLKKVDAGGGSITSLTDEAKGCDGATWSRDGTILFGSGGKILKVSASGSPATDALTADAPAKARAPWFLPDGRHFLFYAGSLRHVPQGNTGVYLGDLATGTQEFLTGADLPYGHPAGGPKYAAPGFLLYNRGNKLMVQPFDAGKLRLAGEAVAIGPVGDAFAVNDNGVLAYFDADGMLASVSSEMIWYTRDGKQTARLGSPGDLDAPRLSPDGQRVAVGVWDDAGNNTGSRHIWVYDVARGTATRVTFAKSGRSHPVWSPDGKRLLFLSDQGRTLSLNTKDPSGLGEEQKVLDFEDMMFPQDWSADGRNIAYVTWEGGIERIGVLQLMPEKKAGLLLRADFDEFSPRFSPDGKWFAYSSKETGAAEVYVTTFPGLTAKWRVSTEGGSQPIWRRDGKELFYVAPDGKIIAVAVARKGEGLEFAKPVVLFQTRITDGFVQYDVTADGQKFIVNSNVQYTPEPITIVTNWTALLKK